MAVFETVLKSDLKKPVQVKQLSGNLFSGDNNANKISVEVTDNGSPATLSGNVTGYVIREDNSTITIANGTLTGNKASITLPTSVYAVVGRVSIVVKVGTTTVGACTAYVYRTTTDTIVDPGSVVPDISELLALIGECEAATTAATNAAIAAGYVNINMSKSGNVITVTTTNSSNQSTSKTLIEPTLTVSESNGVVTVTATDESGTTTVTFNAVTLDDTAGIGDTDLVYSADKVRKEIDTKAPVVDVPITTPASVQSFPDGADGLPMALTVGIEPVQNLHGYDKPWVGGAGKNLVYIDHTQGSALSRGLTATKNSDGSITVKGTYTSSSNGFIGATDVVCSMAAGSYTLSGCPSSAYSTYGLRLVAGSTGSGMSTVYDEGSENSITLSENDTVYLQIGITASVAQNTPLPTEGITFYPMIRLATTDSAYEPYTNICPISGWTGANVTRTGINLIPNGTNTDNGYKNNQYIKASNGGGASSTSYYSSEFFKVNPNTVYTLSDNNSESIAGEPAIVFYDKDKNFIEGSGVKFGGVAVHEITTPENAVWARCSQRKSDSGAFIQFEYGTHHGNAKTYEGSTYSITFPSSAGTVYGGELTVNGDGTGTLKVDRHYRTFNGTETWIVVGSGDNTLIRTTKDADGNYYPASKTQPDPEFTISTVAPQGSVTTSNADFNFTVYHSGTNTYPFIQFRPKNLSDITTSEQAAQYVAGLYNAGTPISVCYQLATPVSYTLTAPQVKTLLGVNNLFADCGSILSVTYPADTKLYIDNYGQTEEDFTANTNIANGEYFQIGNTLYLATSAIANGETIVPGTNCTKTTIAEVLNANATGMSF